MSYFHFTTTDRGHLEKIDFLIYFNGKYND